MITATFTQFRNNAASYFDRVEQGEAVQIYRNGKPSALLVKAETKVETKSYWKSVKPLLDLGNDSASKMLLEERRRGR
jgi:antitoxin (DNA-binding transcriptional repressor) of toxin-antitoxin stability system